MNEARIVAFALLCCACQDGVAFLPRGDARSLLLVEVDGTRVEAVAFDLDAREVVERAAPESGDLYALGYDALLPVGPGVVALDPAGVALPPPDWRYVLDGASWDEVALPPPVIAEVRVRREMPCASFTIRTEELPRMLGEEPSVALALDERRVLLATDAGRFWIATSTGVTPLALPAGTPSRAGAIHEGEVWLVGNDRQVVRGHPDRGFVPAPPLPFALATLPVMDASRAGAPLELFVTDETLAVAHFDGQDWTQIRAATGLSADRVRPIVGWIDPGLAGVLGTGPHRMLELRAHGSERSLDLDVPIQPSPDTLWVIGYVEGVGPIAATRYNTAFRRVESGWDRLPLSDNSPRADVVIDLGDGTFLAGGQDGFYQQWGLEPTLCPPIMGLGERVDLAARLGRGFFAFASFEERLQLSTITRVQ